MQEIKANPSQALGGAILKKIPQSGIHKAGLHCLSKGRWWPLYESGICPAPFDYLWHKASLFQDMSNKINNFLLCLSPHMLSSLSIWNIRCLIMCSKYCLHFSSRLCFVTKQEIEFFPCADIVSYFLLLLLVCDWPSVRWHLKIICCGSLCPKYQVRS